MKKAVNFIKVLGLIIVPVLLIASCSKAGVPTQSEKPSTPTVTPSQSDKDHVHSYSDTVINPTCTEDGYTIHTCSCGDTKKDTYVTKLGHSFGDWVVTKAPTASEEGQKERTCTRCNVKETGTIPFVSTEHKHNMGNWTVAKNPTESEEGLLVKTCKDEDYQETFVLPSLNSSEYKKGPNSKEATCKETGVCEYVYSKDGQNFTFNVTLPMVAHSIEIQKKDATCTEAGYIKHTCSACGYKTEETIKPLGHTWDHEEATCEHEKKCTVCNVVGQTIKAHNPVANTTSATCTEDGCIVYTCQYCNKKLSEEKIPAIGHVYSDWEPHGSNHKNENCQNVQEYTRECILCHNTETEVEVISIEHSYVSTISKEATCTEEGIITYTCSDCNSVYTKNYENTSAHNFVSKGITEGIETLECEHCHNEKTVLSFKTETEASIDKNKLNNEIELKNASIALDKNTVESLPSNVTIKADTVDKGDLGLNSETNQKIGDNTIYNFGMSNEENQITSFNGVVTVRVPYELKDDENPDEIAIWYINEDGSITPIKAKYSNGFAEFETNHFSYYTVIRLSGADRCKLYEHDYDTKDIVGDCFHDSYTICTCKYCGDVKKINVVEHNGHEYKVVDKKDAACTEAGYNEYKCNNCDSSYKEYIIAPGHDYKLHTDSVLATCEHAGSEKYECSVCHDTYVVTIAQQSHQFKDVITPPTCTEAGYTTHTCKYCDLVIVDTKTNPTGHSYVDSVVPPTCTEAGYTTHTCKNCNDKYITNEVPAKHTWNIDEPTCGEGQVCTICGHTGLPATEEHVYNNNNVCVVCGKGCTHVFETETIEPTCTTEGYTIKTCTLCGTKTKTDIVPSLGHNGNIICTTCGEIKIPQETLDNLLSSYKNINSISISIPLATVTVIEEESEKVNVTLSNLKLSIGLVNNELVGYGSATIDMNVDNNVGFANVTLIYKNNTLYLKAKQSYVASPEDFDYIYDMSTSSYDPKDMYYVASIDEILEDAKLPNIEAIEQMLEEYQEMIGDIVDVLTKIYNTNKPLLKEMAIGFLDKMFTLTNNNTSYTLDFNIEYFIDIYEYVKTHKVSEIVDYIIGKGTYSSLIELVDNLDKLTVGQVLDAITKRLGISIEEIVDLLNKYVPVGEGITVEDLVNQILGNEEGKLADYLKTELFRGIKLFDFVKGLCSKNGLDIDLAMYQQTAKEILNNFKDLYLEDIIGMFIEEVNLEHIYEMIDPIIDEYKDDISLSITIDYLGNIESITVDIDTAMSIKDNDVDLDISISSSFNEDVVIEDDFTEFVDNFRNLDLVTLFKNSGITLTKDENDNIIGFEFTTEHEYTHEYDDNYFTYTYETKETYTYHVTFDGYISSIESDCAGWYILNYSVDDVKESIKTSTIEKIYYKGILVDQRIDEDNVLHAISHKSFMIFYNTKTNKVKIDENLETMHDYRLVEHTEQKGCCSYGYDKYVCAECGYTLIEYSYHGHTNKAPYIQELVNPEGSCEDGVKFFFICTDCGKKVYSHTSYGHVGGYNEKIVLKDGATSCEDGIIISWECKTCGEIFREYEENHHYQINDEISLEDYGFIGTIETSSCVCEEYFDYKPNFAFDDRDYDVSEETIDGILYRKHTETYYYKGNKFVIETIESSVTTGCTRVDTITKYIGIKEDGTYLFTIDHEYTSDSHIFQAKETTTKNEDGTTTSVIDYQCEICNAIEYRETNTYDTHGNIIETIYQDSRETRINRYTIINGKSYTCFERREDGDDWSQIEYTYRDCMVYIVESNSNGIRNERSEVCHVDMTLIPPTCTQPGYFVCGCGSSGIEGYPERHLFQYVDDKYICLICGIENPDHSDGPICIEDLTADDSDSYVVGCCYDIYSNADLYFSVSVLVNDEAYNLDYHIDYELNVYEYIAYTSISINKKEINDLVIKLLENNNIDLDSTVKVVVNALDVESGYKTLLVLE